MKKTRLLAGLLGLSLLATITAAALPAAAAQPAWGSCPSAPDARQQCATVDVPLNYADPAGTQIPIAISRISTAKPGLRRGVLFLIPGGPGNSGIDLPSADAAKLPQAVLDRYDLVSFDPRGVGRSDPVSCDLPDGDFDFLPWPAPDGDISGNVAQAREVAGYCARNGGPVLRSLSTPTEARDIDRIRQALGENKISYWGTSYGTYVGAVYANLFAQHTDLVVLDSNDDPNPKLVEQQWMINRGVGVADRFPDFAAWAADPANPDRVAGTPAEVRAEYLALAAQLDQHPQPWPGASPPELTGNALREAVVNAMTDDSSFPGLAQLMNAAEQGKPLPPSSGPPTAYLQNPVAVALGTVCGDIAFTESIDQYARAVAINKVRYPLTNGMPANISPCSFWPYPPAQQPVPITDRGPANIVLIQNLRDPATPYVGALNSRRLFGRRAIMVTVDSGGHGVYLANGNACGDNAVTRFLVTGIRPATDQFCPAS